MSALDRLFDYYAKRTELIAAVAALSEEKSPEARKAIMRKVRLLQREVCELQDIVEEHAS